LKVSKYFKIPEELKRRFEWLLDYFHLSATDVLTPMVQKWVEENEKQAKIESFLPSGSTVNIFQPTQVNVSIDQKFEISLIKQDLEAALNLASRNPDDWQFQRDLLKKAVKASRLFKLNRDPELEALIRRVEETL